MLVTVNKEINYVEEANSILYNYVNAHSYEKMKQEAVRKVAYNSDLYNNRYQQIINISNYVIDNIRFEKSRLEYFFKEIGNSRMAISNYLLPLYAEKQYSSVSEYEAIEKSKNSGEIIKKFDYILGQHYTFGNGDDKPIETLEDMVRVMEKGDFTAEDKWKILQAYLGHDKYLEELCLILDKTVQLLGERKEEINKLETEFYDYWFNYVNNNNFLDQLQKCANLKWKYNENGHIILPTIFSPYIITISITDENENNFDVIHIGILLDSNLLFKQTKVDSEDLNNTLKLLSDRSKFEILRYIKDKPAYGFEIANELNLSTSTISYHMNGLIQAGLIKIEKEANKIYYSINKTAVKTLLEDIEYMLLQ